MSEIPLTTQFRNMVLALPAGARTTLDQHKEFVRSQNLHPVMVASLRCACQRLIKAGYLIRIGIGVYERTAYKQRRKPMKISLNLDYGLADGRAANCVLYDGEFVVQINGNIPILAKAFRSRVRNVPFLASVAAHQIAIYVTKHSELIRQLMPELRGDADSIYTQILISFGSIILLPDEDTNVGKDKKQLTAEEVLEREQFEMQENDDDDDEQNVA